MVGGRATPACEEGRAVTRVSSWEHWFTGLGAGASVVGSKSPLTLRVLGTSVSPVPPDPACAGIWVSFHLCEAKAEPLETWNRPAS